MSQAIAMTRRIAADSVDTLRFAIVSACGCALIVAGQALPF